MGRRRLDLADVHFLDRSGLGLLVRFLTRTQTARGDLKLCAVPVYIREVLRVTRLETRRSAPNAPASGARECVTSDAG